MNNEQRYRMDCEALRTYVSCGRNIRKTAEKLGKNRDTIGIRFRKIQETTGLAPQNFQDLSELLEIISDRKRKEW